MLEFGVFSIDINGLETSSAGEYSKNRMSNIPLVEPFGTEEGPRFIESSLVASDTNEKVELLSQESSKFSSFATCDKLPASSPTANGNDGNVPSNIIDNNLNTRWSNLGQGSWIQLDLGSMKSICSVDIAWYLGNQRQNNFIISTSDDGTTFTQKHSGTSSGTTTSPEKYTFTAPAEGRYVRITVNGNTQNDWASITEIATFGDAAGGGSPVPTDPGPTYHRWQNTVGSSTSWSAYQSLGGNIASKAAAALNPDGRLEIFVISVNNQLYHRWQTTAGSSSSWSAWTSLGGNLVGNPAVAINSDGRLEVFAVSATNNQLYHRWQTTAGSTTAWSAWTSLGGNFKSSPAVAINSDGRLEVFVVSANNQLYHKWQNTPSTTTNSWSAYQSLGGTIKGDPAVARNNDGRLDVFVIGANGNALYHKWQNTVGTTTNSWSAYQSLGGNIKSDPDVAVNSGGRLEVFVVSANNQLYHKWQNTAGTTNSWSAYHSLGGNIKGDPDVARNNDGRLEAFVIGANGNALYHKWQNTAGTTTSWSAYQSLGGTLKGDPSVARNADGRLEAFVIGGGSGGGGGGGDAGTNDQFGLKKIYSTKSDGEQWFMNMEDPENDPRSDPPEMTKNTDGSWRVTSGQVRYGVFTSSGYHPEQVVKNHATLASRGYMQSTNDWKNIEMTGQVRYNSGGDDEWTWYARGGRHTGSGSPDGCEGVAYKGSLAYTGGQVRWAKEQWHVSYVFQPWENSPANGDGQFVGFKVVMYNMQLDGKTVVKLESYVDPTNNNQWQKVYDFIDQGGWGNEGGECNGAS